METRSIWPFQIPPLNKNNFTTIPPLFINSHNLNQTNPPTFSKSLNRLSRTNNSTLRKFSEHTTPYLPIKDHLPIETTSFPPFYELKNSLKEVFSYYNMSDSEKLDFEDEISVLIPSPVSADLQEAFTNFDRELSKNTHHKVIHVLNKQLGSPVSAFLFLNILFSFSSGNEYRVDKMKNDFNGHSSIPFSYIDSHKIFWKNYTLIRNFLILQNRPIPYRLNSQIRNLVQITIKLLINLNVIKEQRNFHQIPTSNKKSTFNKEVISYKLIINYNYNPSFNFRYEFFMSPLRIVYFENYIKVVESPSQKFKKRANTIECQKVGVISGPLYLRTRDFTRANPYGVKPFVLKEKRLGKLYAETKFFPDRPFIEFIKTKYYSNVRIEEIRKRMIDIKTELEYLYGMVNWKLDTSKKVIDLQRSYAKTLEEEKIWVFLNHNWEFSYFLAVNHDYRGRVYYCSPLAFTNFKFSRYFFHQGYNGHIPPRSFSEWDRHPTIFAKIEEIYSIKLNDDRREIIGLILIGLGKFSPTRKTKTETSLQELLEWGLSSFICGKSLIDKKSWEFIAYKDRMDILEEDLYKFTLDAFLRGDMTKRCIVKDAIGAAFMDMGFIVGVGDKLKLKSINLGDGFSFTDTYLLIKEKFDQSFPGGRIPLWAEKYFKRSIIKSFTLIIPYSAGYEKCFSEIELFIEKNDLKRAKALFKMFYNFIKEDLWKHLGYASSYKTYIQEIFFKKGGSNSYSWETSTATSDFEYKKTVHSELDTQYYFGSKGTKRRTTRQFIELTTQTDEKNSKTAIYPHSAHFFEAEIARRLRLEPYNLSFIIIHDAFIISIFDGGRLVHSYSSVFKAKIGFEHSPPLTSLL